MSLLSDYIAGKLPIGGEFQGYTGDCTDYAYMVSVAAEIHTPCDKIELNRLTAIAIANGFSTSPNGAMSAANLAGFCQFEHTNYNQQSGGNMISTLTQNDYNRFAVVLQVLNGSMIPGNEGGVNGHAVCVLDYDVNTQTLIIANGDSVGGRQGQLDTIHLIDVQNAHPFAVTVIEATLLNSLAKYFNEVSPTEWTLASNPQIVLHLGMLAYWQEISGLPGLPKTNESYSLQSQYPGHNVSVQVFERAIQVYDPDHVVLYENGSEMAPPNAGPCYLAHIDDPAMGIVPKAHIPSLNLGQITHSNSEIVIPFTLE